MRLRHIAALLLLTLTVSLPIFTASCASDEDEAEETAETTREPPSYTGIRTITYSCPAGKGSIDGEAFQVMRAGELTTKVKAVASEGYVFSGWSDGVTSSEREGDIIYEDTTVEAVFDYDYLGMAVMSINTRGEREVTSRDKYISCTVDIATPDGSYTLTEAAAEIRGRGNATWNMMDKKSYRLKLGSDRNLLNQDTGAESTWVLLANHCDQSMLRHRLAFKLAEAFDNIEVWSSSNFVTLYFNGRYDGVYLLCEQPEVGRNRVNVRIDDTVNTGYFIELDQYYDGEEDYDYVFVHNHYYTVKSDTRTPEQIDYLKNYLQEIEDALDEGSKEDFCELVDIDNCVDTYILQEFMKNIDVGWSSFYMYIKEDGGKLYFGPPWDFDLACGNDMRLDDGGAENIYVGANYGFSQSHRWFIKLMTEMDWFEPLVRARWAELSDEIESCIRETEECGLKYEEAIERNYNRWEIFGTRQNQEPYQVMALTTYREHLDYLVTWCFERLAWLDNYFT